MIELTSKYADYILLLIFSYILIAAMVLLTEKGEREGKFLLSSGLLLNFIIAKPMLLSGYSLLITLTIVALSIVCFFAVYYVAKFIFNKRFRIETINTINESQLRELTIFTIYFLIMLSVLIILTLMKNNDYVLSVLPVEVFINPHIPIAKAGLVISAGLIICECIYLYRKNKKGDNNA